MKTVYVNLSQRPPAPSFVDRCKDHLATAKAMDHTTIDTDPNPNSVKVEQGDLRVTLTPNSAGDDWEKFQWTKGDDRFGDSETFSIERGVDQDLYTYETTELGTEWSSQIMEKKTELAGLSVQDGGLLFQEDHLDYFDGV